jgi:hypothetical protein
MQVTCRWRKNYRPPSSFPWADWSTIGLWVIPSGNGIFQKIRALPDEKVAEVENFVNFLSRREDDRSLVHAASRLSSESLRKVWDNPDDADYDPL